MYAAVAKESAEQRKALLLRAASAKSSMVPFNTPCPCHSKAPEGKSGEKQTPISVSCHAFDHAGSTHLSSFEHASFFTEWCEV